MDVSLSSSNPRQSSPPGGSSNHGNTNRIGSISSVARQSCLWLVHNSCQGVADRLDHFQSPSPFVTETDGGSRLRPPELHQVRRSSTTTARRWKAAALRPRPKIISSRSKTPSSQRASPRPPIAPAKTCIIRKLAASRRLVWRAIVLCTPHRDYQQPSSDSGPGVGWVSPLSLRRPVAH
jgi:hypothetical protein